MWPMREPQLNYRSLQEWDASKYPIVGGAPSRGLSLVAGFVAPIAVANGGKPCGLVRFCALVLAVVIGRYQRHGAHERSCSKEFSSQSLLVVGCWPQYCGSSFAHCMPLDCSRTKADQ